jgi:predicted restriction endonuclease
MTLLENYLDNYHNKELDSSIYSMYEKFGYDDEDVYHMDLDFMLQNIYNIKIVESKLKRMGQQEFRQKILELYNNRCIITDNDCDAELEACHIIPVSTCEDYSLDNGLLIEKNKHSTFDKYLWSINPDTFMIECLDNAGTIEKYKGKKLNLNEDIKVNLIEHYNIFKSNNNY